MKKSELLGRVREAHGALTRALDGLTEEDATRVGVNPQWSVKDVLAHVTAWGFEGVRVINELRQGAAAPPRFDQEAIDGFNAAAVEARRARTFAQVRAEFDAAHRTMSELLEALPDEVDESSREYRFAEILAIIHYTHHAAQIEEWKNKIGGHQSAKTKS